MQETILEIITELVSLILVTVGAGGMTLLGLISNQNGFSELLNGDMVVGIWLLAVGGVALYGGIYLFGYQGILPRIQMLFQREDEITE